MIDRLLAAAVAAIEEAERKRMIEKCEKILKHGVQVAAAAAAAAAAAVRDGGGGAVLHQSAVDLQPTGAGTPAAAGVRDLTRRRCAVLCRKGRRGDRAR